MVIYVVDVVARFSHLCFFLMIRRPPRSTLDRSSAASDVYKRQVLDDVAEDELPLASCIAGVDERCHVLALDELHQELSLIHISEPTRPY